jgi:hypothetical protein
MSENTSTQTTKEARLADALDRIARFSEAYELATEERSYKAENVGSALCITLGHYARKVLDGR